MKKLLIGTTALVAGGLIAGSAVAADLIPAPAPEIIDDGFTVTWSGFIRSGFYVGDTDCDNATGTNCQVTQTGGPIAAGLDADYENTVVPINGELQLFAEQTLANGMRVGGEIDFGIAAASGGSVSIDELWLFLDTHIGQIRLGQKEGALDSLGGGSLPGWGAFNGGTDGPDMNPLASSNSSTASISSGFTGSREALSGDANKVTYLSPTMSGVNFAVSFTPDPDSENGTGRSLDINGTGTGAAAANQHVNEWSVAANVTHTYGDHTLHVAGGFSSAEAEKNNPSMGDVDHWKIAGSIKNSYGGIGGFYTNRDNGTVTVSTGTVGTAAGAVSETDSWGVTANIIHGDYTVGGGYTNVTDTHFNTGATSFTDSERDIFGFGVSKALGTGVSTGVNATVATLDDGYDRNAATDGLDASGWLAGWYMAISF